jgi:hypothetical protein
MAHFDGENSSEGVRKSSRAANAGFAVYEQQLGAETLVASKVYDLVRQRCAEDAAVAHVFQKVPELQVATRDDVPLAQQRSRALRIRNADDGKRLNAMKCFGSGPRGRQDQLERWMRHPYGAAYNSTLGYLLTIWESALSWMQQQEYVEV